MPAEPRPSTTTTILGGDTIRTRAEAGAPASSVQNVIPGTGDPRSIGRTVQGHSAPLGGGLHPLGTADTPGFSDGSGGSAIATIESVTADNAKLAIDVISVLSGAVATVNLPDANANLGHAVIVKKFGIAGDVTVVGEAAQLIDGSATYLISGSYGSATLIAKTDGWYAFPGIA